MIIKVKREVNFNYDSDEKNLEETEPIPGVAGMTPVETATLLLLSRIALFNKVRLEFGYNNETSQTKFWWHRNSILNPTYPMFKVSFQWIMEGTKQLLH